MNSNFRVFFSCWNFPVRKLRNKSSAETVPPVITKILIFCATDSEFFFNRPNLKQEKKTKFSNFYFISKTIPIQRSRNWYRFWNQKASCNRYSIHHIYIETNISILKPTCRYWSQHIDTYTNVSIFNPQSIFNPTYRYSNQRIDTQANISIFNPIYR